MPILTTAQRLEQVQAAITAVLLNQSYTIDGRTVSRANLSALDAMEKRLLAQYAREQGTKPVAIGSRFDSMGYPEAGSTEVCSDTGTVIVVQGGP
jgi:hypothetical protein